jgi:hypothetical protein
LCKPRRVEGFLAIQPKRPIRRDMPIELLPRDAQLFAERADARITLAHACHREPQLCGRHFRLASADASARSASAAKTLKTSLPAAVVVSIAAPQPG